MVFLESWYHQKDCTRCGAQLCWIDGCYRESDGTDHREGCERVGGYHAPRFHEPVVPEKPRHTLRALEHEVLHEGQRTLASFSKTHKKLYPERYPK